MRSRFESSSRPESEESDDQRLVSSPGFGSGPRRGCESSSKRMEDEGDGEGALGDDWVDVVDRKLGAMLLRW